MTANPSAPPRRITHRWLTADRLSVRVEVTDPGTGADQYDVRSLPSSNLQGYDRFLVVKFGCDPYELVLPRDGSSARHVCQCPAGVNRPAASCRHVALVRKLLAVGYLRPHRGDKRCL